MQTTAEWLERYFSPLPLRCVQKSRARLKTLSLSALMPPALTKVSYMTDGGNSSHRLVTRPMIVNHHTGELHDL